MTWNARLKAARIKKGITKSELAKQARVSAPTVTDWENGQIKKIDGENLLRVCSALSVSPTWLILGENEQYFQSKEVTEIAAAFARITDPEQRQAIITQLKAFGVLAN